MRHRKQRARRAIGSTLAGGLGLIMVVATSGVVLQGSAANSAVAQPYTSTAVAAAPDRLTTPQVAPGGGMARGDEGDPPSPGTSYDDTAGNTSAWHPPAGMRIPDSDLSTLAPGPIAPGIEPSAVTHLSIPAIDVDADVRPVDSAPTGRQNAWGGEIYGTIDFPVDQYVRQWVRRGEPNTLPGAESAGDPRAFDRVYLYGHASDIGHHLVFQDLSALRPGDEIVVSTDLGEFTYAVTTVLTRAKVNLESYSELYEYPAAGAKEIALIACLPDTSSNVAVLGALVAASPVP